MANKSLDIKNSKFMQEVHPNTENMLPNKKSARSGTFIDNMKLPVHRWFRYSAGFSAEWVEQVILENKSNTILDPFVGSGTVCIAADKLGIPSYGVEAHPYVYRLGLGKLAWPSDIPEFKEAITELIKRAEHSATKIDTKLATTLITKCYSNESLKELYSLRSAFASLSKNWGDAIASLVFLCINSILRPTSHVGTAQWQYVLPNKTKAKVLNPLDALKLQAEIMATDMSAMQSITKTSRAKLISGDSRTLTGIPDNCIDLVITSPPYANNYDYADATRLEMSFWGEISTWGDLHDSVRQFLICSSTQHASKDRLKLDILLNDRSIDPIKKELTQVCHALDTVRKTKGGNKSYHLMIAAYFSDMSKTFQALRRVTREGASMCLVIGDSAPYGIHAPVERWFGELAIAHGFNSWEFEKIRDRNTKWKNRKHTVLLHEGRLWIKG